MSITLDSVERINTLKQGIETVTGESYNDLTEGVQVLKDGYGKGDTEEIERLIDESGVIEYDIANR